MCWVEEISYKIKVMCQLITLVYENATCSQKGVELIDSFNLIHFLAENLFLSPATK